MMKYLEMVRLTVKFKIDSIDGRMFGFALINEDGIKLGLIERTELGSLMYYYGRYRNHKLDGSLDGILRRRNFKWQDFWFT